MKRILKSIVLLTLSIVLCLFSSCSLEKLLNRENKEVEPDFLQGTEIPSQEQGNENDLYFDESTGDLYRKSTTWNVIGSCIKRVDDFEYIHTDDGECTLLGPSNFRGNNLVIPDKSPDGDKITYISPYAFYGRDYIKTVKVGENVESVGDYSFMDCINIVQVEVAENTKKIGDWAFAGTDIQEIRMESVEEIGECIFFGCDSLTTIYLGQNVKKIDSAAFNNCPNLILICFGGTIKELEELIPDPELTFMFSGNEDVGQINLWTSDGFYYYEL